MAIDAGGTSTRCMLASSDGAVRGIWKGGPANHILSGWETAKASLTDATRQALAAAGSSDVDVAVIGSAGVGPNGEGCEAVEWLLRELVPGAKQVLAIVADEPDTLVVVTIYTFFF